MNIGEMLKARRLARGLTLEQVASIVGVGKATVSRWESGSISNMRRDKIAKLADALGIDPAEIVSMYDPAPTPGLKRIEDLHEPTMYQQLFASPALAQDQMELLNNYNQLNAEGKEELRKHARVMVLSGEYVQREKSVLASGS